jgi:hypothetical protein
LAVFAVENVQISFSERKQLSHTEPQAGVGTSPASKLTWAKIQEECKKDAN